MRMDIVRLFSYMFKDSSWFFKVFLGGAFLVLSVVLIGLPFILGYQIEHIRGVAVENGSILPEWKSMRKLFNEGFTVLCASLVYTSLVLFLIVATSGTHATSLIVAAVVLIIFFWMPLVLIQFTKRSTFFSCFSILEIVKRCALHPLLYSVSLATGFLTIAVSVFFGGCR